MQLQLKVFNVSNVNRSKMSGKAKVKNRLRSSNQQTEYTRLKQNTRIRKQANNQKTRLTNTETKIW